MLVLLNISGDNVPIDGIAFLLLLQDYPSVAMVKSILQEKGISPIFLVTQGNLPIYRVSGFCNFTLSCTVTACA